MTQKNKTIILGMMLLIMMMLVGSVIASPHFTQSLPNVINNRIDKIKALPNGWAVAISTCNEGNNLLVYNPSTEEWNEIALPTGYIGSNTNINDMDKVEGQNYVYIYFSNKCMGPTTGNFDIAKFYPATNTWSIEEDGDGVMLPYTNQGGYIFSCATNPTNCYYANGAIISRIYTIDGYYVTLPVGSTAPFINQVTGKNRRLWVYAGTGNSARWNGVSWVSYTTSSYVSAMLEQTSDTKGAMSGSYTGYWISYYNYTANIFQNVPYNSVNGDLYLPYVAFSEGSGQSQFWVGGRDKYNHFGIFHCDWDDHECTGDTDLGIYTLGVSPSSMDYDEDSGTGWVGMNNGNIYEFMGTPSGTPSVIQTLTTNPVQKGNTTYLRITPSHPASYNSNLTTTITGTCVTGTITLQSGSVSSGTTIQWTINTANATYQQGTCTIHTIGHFSNGDNQTASDLTLTIGAGKIYDTFARISPNPTTYGNQVIFYSRATNPDLNPSNLTLYIYGGVNYSTLIHTATANNVPNGVEAEMYRLTLNSPLWTQYPYGAYLVYTQGDTYWANGSFETGIGNEIPPDYGFMIWNVTQGQMTNETGYEMTCYAKQPVNDTGFTYISSLTAWSGDIVYSSIEDSTGKPFIASWDTSNPANIKYSRQSVSPQDQSGANGNPSLISGIDLLQGTDKLYVGTDDDLFIYTNASSKKAINLQYNFDKGFGALSNDGIIDVSAMASEYAYVCQDGSFIDDDDIYLYNYTLADFQDKMNNNPCQDLKYQNGWIYAHRGGNRDVKIWNSITKTNVATIDYTSTISTLSYNDLIDYHNNYLFFLAGKSELRRYDISNHTNPVIAGKCFVPDTIMNATYINDMVALETISDDEVLVGIFDNFYQDFYIGVCDFSNNETYSAIKGGYLSQVVVGSLQGARIWDIIKNNDAGKFSVAMQSYYDVCQYERTFIPVPINQPPIIDEYTITPSQTICKNQEVEIEIIAHDPDTGDTLSYGISCSGGGNPTNFGVSNVLHCSYSTAGTKTIIMQVKDSGGAYSTPATDSILVNDCQQNNTNITTLFFKIIDGETAQAIEGASVQVFIGEQLIGSDTTNNNGYADFTVAPNTQYRATFSKDNYAPKTEYFYPSNTRYTRAIEPTTCNNCTIQRTLLVVNVQDNNNTALEGVLVATLDPTTGASRYGLTDFSGNVYLFDVIPSNSFIVGAKKDGYASTSVYASIGTGETKNVNIIMGQSRGANGYFPATDRTCADTIKGVWLCGNLSYAGGNSCDDDDDCMSGRCSLAISPEARVCSRFNYTLCDVQGINRGNTCIFKNMTRGIFQTMGDMILGNFMYVLLLVLIIVAGLIIRRSLTH